MIHTTSRPSINYPPFNMKPNNKCKYIVQHIILTVIYAAHIKNDKTEKERQRERQRREREREQKREGEGGRQGMREREREGERARARERERERERMDTIC